MRVLVSPGLAGEPLEHFRARLPGFEVVGATAASLAQDLRAADVIVPGGMAVGRDVLEASPTLGLVQTFGVGADKVDLAAATELGVWVANAPSGPTSNADSVAEHAVMLLLAASRQLGEAMGRVRSGDWGRVGGRLLRGKTVCVVGLGGIGAGVARRLAAFDCVVVGVRRESASPPPEGVAAVYGPDRLHEALSRSDAVVLAAPATPETHHMIDAAALAAMRSESYVVNVARGSLIDQRALLESLESGHTAAAGLDVFEPEPIDPDHPLVRHPHVVATPHIAGAARESLEGIAAYAAENVRRFAEGEALPSALNAPPSPRRPLS